MVASIEEQYDKLPESLDFSQKMSLIDWNAAFKRAGIQGFIAGVSTGVAVYAVDHPKFRTFASKVKNLSFDKLKTILNKSGFSDETVEAFALRFGVKKVGSVWDDWLSTLQKKTNPRKDYRDGKFEKYVTGDDIQYEVTGGGAKIWADGVRIESKAVVDAKDNLGSFYTFKSYQEKPFLYGDLEDEFQRYSKVISDKSNPAEELIINLSTTNNDSVKLFEHLGKKYNVKTVIVVSLWNE